MSLTILITNNTLDCYAGSECYTRDVIRYMLRRGHNVIAYSSVLGQLSAELKSYGCVVVDDLERLALVPDIIHGQHHLDATCAMVRFPQVPAIYVTHGVLPWEEAPPPAFKRLLKYVCVSGLTENALLSVCPEARDNTVVIPNFVCEDVFDVKRDLASALQRSFLRALVFGNYKPKELANIRAACAAEGVALDEIGIWSEMGMQPNPQVFLPQYDLVFAYGRSAMEALFCGCEVILAHETGTGELVCDDNFADLRARNFGFTTCQEVKGVKRLRAMIRVIDGMRKRGKLSLGEVYRRQLECGPSLHLLENIYFQVVDGWKLHVDHSDSMLETDSIVLSNYLAKIKRDCRTAAHGRPCVNDAHENVGQKLAAAPIAPADHQLAHSLKQVEKRLSGVMEEANSLRARLADQMLKLRQADARVQRLRLECKAYAQDLARKQVTIKTLSESLEELRCDLRSAHQSAEMAVLREQQFKLKADSLALHNQALLKMLAGYGEQLRRAICLLYQRVPLA